MKRKLKLTQVAAGVPTLVALTLPNSVVGGCMTLKGRFCLMDWNKAGARCSSNIPGMACPRCGVALTETEHTCGRPPKTKVVQE